MPILIPYGDAGAGGHRRLGGRVKDAGRNGGGIGDVFERDRALVAAHPCHRVTGRVAPRSRSAAALRMSSPASWPQRVVDGLEGVEVAVPDRE
jgi:hypothetical protein